MIAVVQRVSQARVEVAGRNVGQIRAGLVALVAVHRDDTEADLEWTAGKLVSLRIFRGGDKHFDRDVGEVGGEILLVSNFTVAGATRKGRRPSLDAAASPEMGREMFARFVERMRATGIPIATGEFGADMQVHMVNDGPVTFILDSREARPTT